jgi:hypothetical protein
VARRAWKEVLRPVFERHEVQYAEVPDDKQAAQSFRIDRRWFRGAEVDRLSLEEARENCRNLGGLDNGGGTGVE